MLSLFYSLHFTLVGWCGSKGGKVQCIFLHSSGQVFPSICFSYKFEQVSIPKWSILLQNGFSLYGALCLTYSSILFFFIFFTSFLLSFPFPFSFLCIYFFLQGSSSLSDEGHFFKSEKPSHYKTDDTHLFKKNDLMNCFSTKN